MENTAASNRAESRMSVAGMHLSISHESLMNNQAAEEEVQQQVVILKMWILVGLPGKSPEIMKAEGESVSMTC